MVACEKTKRRALMMELDPKYCDVIIQRYENYSGKQAVREANDGSD
jgi:DNA modification methylase